MSLFLGKPPTTSLYLPPEEESYLLHVFKGLAPPPSYIDANASDPNNSLSDNPYIHGRLIPGE